MKEYYSVIAFMLISGLVCPSFGMFGYYFMMDTLGISKFTYSLLTLLGFIGVICGTWMYHHYFHAYEFRTMMMIEVAIGLFLAPFSFVLVSRVNLSWGVPDLSLIIFSDAVGDIIMQCFGFLPLAVLISKICP